MPLTCSIRACVRVRAFVLACRHELPGFEISYTPDFRDGIAKTWPDSIDDANARRDWGWEPR